MKVVTCEQPQARVDWLGVLFCDDSHRMHINNCCRRRPIGQRGVANLELARHPIFAGHYLILRGELCVPVRYLKGQGVRVVQHTYQALSGAVVVSGLVYCLRAFR